MMREGKVITTSLPNLADSKRFCVAFWKRVETFFTWDSRWLGNQK